MLKFDKLTLEPQWIDTNICFCNGGDDSDGAADNNPVDAEAGRFSGRGNTQAAAGTPSRGTTFGVDGRSKTGSTALDAAIGYTDSDNRGNAGPNFDALNNATSEQTIAAVAAAREAQDQGGSPGQVQSAVSSALENYSTGTVDRTGALTDKGRSFVDDIVNQTFAPPTPPSDSPVSQALSAGDVTSPEFMPNQIGITAPRSDLMPNQIGITAPVSSEEQLRQATAKLMGEDPNAPVALTVAQRAALTPDQKIDDQIARNRAAIDAMNLTPEEQAQREAIAARQQAFVTGIMTTPQATAANVLGTSINDPQLGNITQTTSPDGTVNRTADLGNFRSSTNITRTPSLDDASMLEDLRTTAPAPGVFSGVGSLLGGGPRTDLQNLISEAAANPRQGYTPNVVSSPALRGEKAAAGTPAENFYTDSYRELYPDVEGNIPGTFMAGVGNTVRNFPGIGMLLGGGPQDLPSASEQAAFKSGELLAMGGTMDPQTGAISDIPAGKGTLDMNRFGMVTYSGNYDPNYTGPYRELVNPPPQDDGREMSKPPTDPCPPGYFLKDGVCTPMMEDEIRTPEGGDFVFQPPNAPPTFQPITQATPVGQINPFVLQPYAPIGINPPVQQAQGIQPMSPTGAALGRQI